MATQLAAGWQSAVGWIVHTVVVVAACTCDGLMALLELAMPLTPLSQGTHLGNTHTYTINRVPLATPMEQGRWQLQLQWLAAVPLPHDTHSLITSTAENTAWVCCLPGPDFAWKRLVTQGVPPAAPAVPPCLLRTACACDMRVAPCVRAQNGADLCRVVYGSDWTPTHSGFGAPHLGAGFQSPRAAPFLLFSVVGPL